MVNFERIRQRIANIGFPIKPAEESVSGISCCGKCNFFVVKIRTAACNCSGLGVVSAR